MKSSVSAVQCSFICLVFSWCAGSPIQNAAMYEHFTFRIIQRKAEMQAKLHMELIPAQSEIKTKIEIREHLPILRQLDYLSIK